MHLLLKQGHLVWLFSIVNIGIGFVIPGFNVRARTISAVALEAPVFAWTHRIADIAIGLSMCLFGVGLRLLGRRRAAFSSISCFILGLCFISAGIWTLESPLHLLYNLSIVMILVPAATALELRDTLRSRRFEIFSLAISTFHVLMFWAIFGGLIPPPWNGAIQRVWAAVMVAWFGVAASLTTRRLAGAEQGTDPV